MRLWFWLDTALSDDEAKVWLRDAPVDLAVFNAVQPIYTAAPIFSDGRADPVPVRSGIREGWVDSVSSPDIELPARAKSGSGRSDLSAEMVREALGFISADCPYDPWVKVGMAIKAALADEGFALFDEWSATAPLRYSPEMTEFKFDSFSYGERAGDVSVGTLISLARKGGWTGSTLSASAFGVGSIPTPTFEPKTTNVIDGTGAVPEGMQLTEDMLASVFVTVHGDKLRYCHTRSCWFVWNGSRWEEDNTGLVLELARRQCREFNREGDSRLGKVAMAEAILKFAKVDRRVIATSDTWDNDPFLVGTPDGTVDLRTGKIRPACQDDFITKLSAVSPSEDAHCPRWLAFLDEATKGDKELIRFLQQIAGYSLTGDTREEALFFVFGTGGNGKGVFLNTVTGIMNDYATTAAMETFSASGSDRHPTELAALKGARLVTASETEEGKAWAESKIKQLTGRDRISARFMRQDFFQFMPQFKLLIIGNHKPTLTTVDEAMKRRFNIIPFVHTPKLKDDKLKDKLRDEWPGILRWMIQGCLDWQANGLIRPLEVVRATDEYGGR